MKIRGLKNKNIKWWIGIISCVTLFSVIMIFSYEKMCFLVKGVEIKATIAQENDSSLATIQGNAEKAIQLTLNGREIFIDKDGNFSEKIAVLPGFSIVTLDAKDKFGKTDKQQFEMVYEGNAKAIAFRQVNIIR